MYVDLTLSIAHFSKHSTRLKTLKTQDAMVSFVRALAIAAVACAALLSSTTASSLLEDPYTLDDGRVIDPTNPNDVAVAEAAKESRSSEEHAKKKTTLRDGPMRGYGRTL